MKRFLIFVIIFICSFLFFSLPNVIQAEEKKALGKYKVDVIIKEDSSAFVTYDLFLQNQSDKYSIEDYTLILDQKDIRDLSVKENGSAADYKKIVDKDVRIKIRLKQMLVKKMDSVSLKITYVTDSILKKEGLLKILYVPSIVTEEQTVSASFDVQIPLSMGELNYISIQDKKIQKKDNKYLISYLNSEAPSGLYGVIGSEQQFEFSFVFSNFISKNKQFFFSLPVNSSNQDVDFLSFPDEIGQVFSNAEGNNILVLSSDKNFRISGVTKYKIQKEKREEQKNVLERSLGQSNYWDFQEKIVSDTLSKIIRSDFTNYENARLIFEFISSSFPFTNSEKKRQKASFLVENNKEKISCINANDLFVSLARGAKIPSRIVVGHNFKEGKLNNLYYWSEFYDEIKKRWIVSDICMKMALKYNGFDIYDPNRIIFGYYSLKDDFPDFIEPFEKYGTENEILEIKPSSYNYQFSENNILFVVESSDPDVFFSKVDLLFIFNNNSSKFKKIFEFNVDGKDSKGFLLKIFDDYTIIIPPGKSSFKINYKIEKLLPLPKETNFAVRIKFDDGDSINSTIKIKRKFSSVQILSWILSVLFGIVITSILFLIYKKRKKIRQLFFEVFRKRKYKYRRSRIF